MTNIEIHVPDFLQNVTIRILADGNFSMTGKVVAKTEGMAEAPTQEVDEMEKDCSSTLAEESPQERKKRMDRERMRVKRAEKRGKLTTLTPRDFSATTRDMSQKSRDNLRQSATSCDFSATTRDMSQKSRDTLRQSATSRDFSATTRDMSLATCLIEINNNLNKQSNKQEINNNLNLNNQSNKQEINNNLNLNNQSNKQESKQKSKESQAKKGKKKFPGSQTLFLECADMRLTGLLDAVPFRQAWDKYKEFRESRGYFNMAEETLEENLRQAADVAETHGIQAACRYLRQQIFDDRLNVFLPYRPPPPPPPPPRPLEECCTVEDIREVRRALGFLK